jgi:hypothetical protein
MASEKSTLADGNKVRRRPQLQRFRSPPSLVPVSSVYLTQPFVSSHRPPPVELTDPHLTSQLAPAHAALWIPILRTASSSLGPKASSSSRLLSFVVAVLLSTSCHNAATSRLRERSGERPDLFDLGCQQGLSIMPEDLCVYITRCRRVGQTMSLTKNLPKSNV